MAVPKKKVSKSRRDMRRKYHKATEVNVKTCKKCGGKTLPHTICKVCGTYNR